MAVGAKPKYVAFALAVAFAFAGSAKAQSVEQFYRGKTIRVVIGYGPGGGYDVYGRLAAEFLGRHIPGNPTMLPENMPGAASLRAVQYLANVAPRDGTYLGSVQQELALTSIIGQGERFDPAQLNYIGRFSSNIDVGVASSKSGISSADDLRKREVTVGTDQTGSMSVAYAKLLDAYAGMKLKIVTGYSGSNEIQLAAERGEIDVNGSYSLPAVLVSHPDWIGGAGAVILYQNALKRFTKLPKTPTLIELVNGDEGRAIAGVLAGTAEVGRSILTTPDVPRDRLQALRNAFQDMLKDPDFIAACAKRRLMLDPAKGEDMDVITANTKKLPSTTINAIEALFKK
jgi:tripartite-type tricarboxylate transporter receptor subunit TctC